MKIEIKTESYNKRRYGKPWVAKVSFNEDGELKYEFHTWIGDPGSEGILVIDANEGDIIANGQRDHRGSNSSNFKYLVLKNGKILHISSKVDIFKLYKKEITAQEYLFNLSPYPQASLNPLF